MPILSFTLSMPNNNAWNGKWSGRDNLYAITKKYPDTIKGRTRAALIAEPMSYYYNFGDGWGASIAVQIVDAKQARMIRSKSQGFCGYEWMVESIFQHGRITTTPNAVSAAALKG